MPFFLIWLSGKRPGQLPPNLARLWHAALTATSEDYSWSLLGEDQDEEDAKKPPIVDRLETAYRELLPDKPLSRDKQEELLSWCLKVARQRTDAIVGNQRRRSYGKAAVLCVACFEVLRLRGARKQADKFLQDTRNRFPRHRAFQSELNAAVW